uniref:CUB domain-containing protein n=1 Tax=Parastrongyloides trichosuri TaxID=131310 RepID=A0A0N4ZXH1_PARTI
MSFGKKTCTIQLKASEGRKIKMALKELKLPRYDVSKPTSGFEIKYFQDKSASGAIFCGDQTSKEIYSEDNFIVMRYIGMYQVSKMKLTYKVV